MKRPNLSRIIVLLLTALLLSGCGAAESRSAPAAESAAAGGSTTSAPRSTPAPAKPDYSDIRMHTVDSSCFSRIGYDADNHILKVQFRDSGEYYVYFDFSEADYEAFTSADSLGKYFNTYIKDVYDYERLR